jgi:hypothetical protein
MASPRLTYGMGSRPARGGGAVSSLLSVYPRRSPHGAVAHPVRDETAGVGSGARVGALAGVGYPSASPTSPLRHRHHTEPQARRQVVATLPPQPDG